MGGVHLGHQALLQPARGGEQALDALALGVAHAGQFHHDPVAFGAGGGDLRFGHAELVDPVLDDLQGALVGVILEGLLVEGLLGQGEAGLGEARVVAAGHLLDDLLGLRAPVLGHAFALHQGAFHLQHGVGEAFFPEPVLEPVAGVPLVGLQRLVALDFQFEVDAALEVKAEAHLGEGNEEIRARTADQEGHREAP